MRATSNCKESHTEVKTYSKVFEPQNAVNLAISIILVLANIIFPDIPLVFVLVAISKLIPGIPVITILMFFSYNTSRTTLVNMSFY